MTDRCPHCERYEEAIEYLGRVFDNFDWTKHDGLSTPQKMALQSLNEAFLKAMEGRGWDHLVKEWTGITVPETWPVPSAAPVDVPQPVK